MIELHAGNRNGKQKFLPLQRALETECQHDRVLVSAGARHAAVEKAVLQQRFKNDTFWGKRKPECSPIELLQSHARNEFAKIGSQVNRAGRRPVGGVHGRIIVGHLSYPIVQKVRTNTPRRLSVCDMISSFPVI